MNTMTNNMTTGNNGNFIKVIFIYKFDRIFNDDGVYIQEIAVMSSIKHDIYDLDKIPGVDEVIGAGKKEQEIRFKGRCINVVYLTKDDYEKPYIWIGAERVEKFNSEFEALDYIDKYHTELKKEFE
jgi:hypothetical protein